MKNINRLSSFYLKIIAMVTMTFDHIGVVLNALGVLGAYDTFYLACRYIGRIALPLYCFLLVESVLNTKHYKKYNIKLGIMALIISIGLGVAQYATSLGLGMIADAGNIFLDLFLGSIMIYCLNHEKKWMKSLAILPFAYSIISFVVKGLERSQCPTCYTALSTPWFPGLLRMQYDWLSLGLMLAFYLGYYVAKLIYKIREEQTSITYEAMKGTNEWRLMVNLSGVFLSIVVSVFYYLFRYINPSIVFWVPKIQLAAIIASVFIVFYSGSRGYNAKWFNWFSYFYYLVHIGVIYGICYVIFML